MGTRATTWIYECWDGELALLAKIYRQFDGYFDGHGKELAEFLAGRKVVDGISDNEPCFNGGGCCAAQVIWFLKDKRSFPLPGMPERPHPCPGNIYMQRLDDERAYFHYDVIVNVDGRSGSIEFVASHDGNERFRGTPSEFLACCDTLTCSDEEDEDEDEESGATDAS